jgi:hypothetical protein
MAVTAENQASVDSDIVQVMETIPIPILSGRARRPGARRDTVRRERDVDE